LVACRGCRRGRGPAICGANGKGLSIGWIVLAVVVAVAVYAIVIYNRLVRLRNMVREGFSGVDVQLRRRTDLVPNLVETVKAYAAHERGVLKEVAATRASSIAASDVHGQAAAARALQAALGRLFALAEAYPQLKADKNFLELQNQLADIEDQLQMARRYYNGTIALILFSFSGQAESNLHFSQRCSSRFDR
jgi:LemA protein